jgi:hypothetical protein
MGHVWFKVWLAIKVWQPQKVWLRNMGHVWFLATLCQAKVWLPQFSWYVFGFLPHFGYKYFILSVAHLS